MSRKKTYILIMQWMAFIVAIVAFLFFVASYLEIIHCNLDIVIPNLVAFYGCLIGGLGIFKTSKDRLSAYFIFLSVCILIVVNFVAFKF